MESRETILNELQATSTILDEGIGLPYVVPSNYFYNLTANLKNVIHNTDIVEETVVSVPDFTIPVGYFNNLSNAILASINKEEVHAELSLIAPVLKTISSTIPYQVPDNYFDNFTLINNPSTSNFITGKVVSIYKKKWFQAAVAASVAGVIAVSGYFIANKTIGVSNTYASYKSVDVQGSVKKVSDDDLEKYLNNTDYLTSNTDVIIGDEGEDLNPKQEIKSVPDNELKQYLREAGENKKTAKKGI